MIHAILNLASSVFQITKFFCEGNFFKKNYVKYCKAVLKRL